MILDQGGTVDNRTIGGHGMYLDSEDEDLPIMARKRLAIQEAAPGPEEPKSGIPEKAGGILGAIVGGVVGGYFGGPQGAVAGAQGGHQAGTGAGQLVSGKTSEGAQNVLGPAARLYQMKKAADDAEKLKLSDGASTPSV